MRTNEIKNEIDETKKWEEKTRTFLRKATKGEVLKILTSKQKLQILPIALKKY